MKLLTALLTAVVLVGAGCPSKTATPTPDTNTSEEIAVSIDGNWELKTFTPAGGEARDVAELGATLNVEPGATLSARICNSMSGGYDINAGVLTVERMASTLMLCTGPAGDVEAAFTDGLNGGMTIEHGGDSLLLRNKAGAMFLYERAGVAAAPSEEVPGEDVPFDDRAYAGVITAIDLEQMMVDGPARIVIRTDADAEAVILVPSMGLPLCAAREALADVYALKVGQRVEARGSVGAEADSIVPCQSAEHYLRVVGSTR